MPLASTPATWDGVSDSYDAHREKDLVYLGCVAESIRHVLSRARGGRVLDAGCGTGISTVPLIPHFKTVVAVDFSTASLGKLRRKASGSQVKVTAGDVTAMGFASDSFDAVLCHNILQHLMPVDQAKAVAELLRVAKTGAPVVIAVHHYHLFRFLENYTKEGRPGEPGIDYIYRFMTREFERLFPAETRDRLEIGASGFQFGTLPGISRLLPQSLLNKWLGARAPGWHLGHMLVGVVVK